MQWQLPDRTLEIGRRPLIMGIVNVTPDSFSDGGRFLDPQRAREQAQRLVEAGADILDIGGESTRPGAEPVSLDEELRRVLPALECIAADATVPISIDTSKAEVARRAVDLGASIINDVTGLRGDPDMIEVARKTAAGVVIMHMQGTPKTMQLAPHYDDVVEEVHSWFESRLATLADDGIEAKRVAVDPGIGFGKRLHHNLELISRLARFLDLGRPICLGVSRKGFINRVLDRAGPVEMGSGGTVGTVLFAMSRGAVQIARVHDVQTVKDAAALFLALEECAAGKRGMR